jgi:hypothetical protein
MDLGNDFRARDTRRQYAAGTLPTYRLGRLIIVGEPIPSPSLPGQTVVCTRVSSADQRPDLDRQVARSPGRQVARSPGRQVARVTEWATGQRMPVDRVVTEVGSALSGHRRTFLALLRDPAVPTIVVEHRTGSPGSGPTASRLTRGVSAGQMPKADHFVGELVRNPGCGARSCGSPWSAHAPAPGRWGASPPQ